MSDGKYTGLTVEVVKTEDGQFYDFGVWIEGEFVIFFKRKAGGLDDAIARAKEATAAEAAAAPPPPTTQ